MVRGLHGYYDVCVLSASWSMTSSSVRAGGAFIAWQHGSAPETLTDTVMRSASVRTTQAHSVLMGSMQTSPTRCSTRSIPRTATRSLRLTCVDPARPCASSRLIVAQVNGYANVCKCVKAPSPAVAPLTQTSSSRESPIKYLWSGWGFFRFAPLWDHLRSVLTQMHSKWVPEWYTAIADAAQPQLKATWVRSRSAPTMYTDTHAPCARFRRLCCGPRRRSTATATPSGGAAGMPERRPLRFFLYSILHAPLASRRTCAWPEASLTDNGAH
jgi:hypothetical protein